MVFGFTVYICHTYMKSKFLSSGAYSGDYSIINGTMHGECVNTIITDLSIQQY